MNVLISNHVCFSTDRISSLTDWRSEDVSGRDIYTLCHPGDIGLLKKIHKDRKFFFFVFQLTVISQTMYYKFRASFRLFFWSELIVYECAFH